MKKYFKKALGFLYGGEFTFLNHEKVTDNAAFTLIEVMVAIGMVTIGMIGVASLMTQNITVQSVNRNNLIASMLAQEGLELVRELRDSNWLKASQPGFSYGIVGDGTYRIDYKNGAVDDVDLITDSAAILKLNTDGFYEHVNGTDTAFRRLIEVSSTNPSVYLQVKAAVRWSKNGKDYDYKAETLLYDWQ